MLTPGFEKPSRTSPLVPAVACFRRVAFIDDGRGRGTKNVVDDEERFSVGAESPGSTARPASRYASGSGWRPGTDWSSSKSSSRRSRHRSNSVLIAAQTRATVDLESAASLPNASANVASTSRTDSPRTNPAITRGLQRVRLGHPRAEQPGDERVDGAAQLGPLDDDRPRGGLDRGRAIAVAAARHCLKAQYRVDAEGSDGRASAIPPGGSAVVPAPGALTDPDVPLYSVGQVSELLGIGPAALRRLDQQGAMRPGRSDGNQRRYSRRQIQRIQRLVQLLGEGLPITAAHRIADLEDQVRRLSVELARPPKPGNRANNAGTLSPPWPARSAAVPTRGPPHPVPTCANAVRNAYQECSAAEPRLDAPADTSVFIVTRGSGASAVRRVGARRAVAARRCTRCPVRSRNSCSASPPSGRLPPGR